MKRKFVTLITVFLSLNLFACAQQLVKTDLRSTNENPEEYKGKRVIVTADIESIVDDTEAYLGKRAELLGYVELDGFIGFLQINPK